MREIRKETLTRDLIRNDLIKYEKYRLSCKQSTSWDFGIFFILLALAIGLFTGVFFGRTVGFILGGVALIPSVYHFIKIITLYKDSLHRRHMMINGEFAISTSAFTRIGEDRVYEPHLGRRRFHYYRIVPFFFFEDVQWRVVQTVKHYEWSALYNMSYQGLQNTSIPGDEFYVVYLDRYGDVCYIYNKKLFELKDCTVQTKWSSDESEE